MYTALESSYIEGFPLPPCLRDVTEGAVVLQTSTKVEIAHHKSQLQTGFSSLLLCQSQIYVPAPREPLTRCRM